MAQNPNYTIKLIIIIIINDIYIAPFKGPKAAVHGGQNKTNRQSKGKQKRKEAGGPRKGSGPEAQGEQVCF